MGQIASIGPLAIIYLSHPALCSERLTCLDLCGWAVLSYGFQLTITNGDVGRMDCELEESLLPSPGYLQPSLLLQAM